MIAQALLGRARAIDARSLAVVGTSKNAGKSVVVAALAHALQRESRPFGIVSIGRDGEAVDIVTGTPKPRFFLRPGAVFATARSLLPRAPACAVLATLAERSALGAMVVAAVRTPGYVELAGPASARDLRRVVATLAERAPFVVVDGAIDRIAALRDGDDAIVVSVGAASAPTMARAVTEAAALVRRLRVARVDRTRPFVQVTGALTLSGAAEFARTGETRQIVVADPTRIAFGGRAFVELAARLDLRCERTLRPIACTVAPLCEQRCFEPEAFARAVARACDLPTYDLYRNVEIVPEAA